MKSKKNTYVPIDEPKKKDAAEVLLKRLNKSGSKHLGASTGYLILACAGAGAALPTFGASLAVSAVAGGAATQQFIRLQKVVGALTSLEDAYNAATPAQRKAAIEIVENALVAAGMARDGKDAWKKLGKDKAAILLADTLKVVKDEKKLTDSVKNTLTDKIAEGLKVNKKKDTTFKNFKGRFEKKGHVHMKEGGYEVERSLRDALHPTGSHSEGVSLSRSNSSKSLS